MGLAGGRGLSPETARPTLKKETEALEKNLTLRIPTPTFGAGLIEQIDDSNNRRERESTRQDASSETMLE